MDEEQLAQENNLWPHLNDESMTKQSSDFFDDLNEFEDYEDDE